MDFVEVETAWHHVLWDEEARKQYEVPWWRRGWLRWRTWRSPEAGIAHLEWASTLTYVDKKGVEHPTTQAVAAKEILDLYHWWKEDYPNRPDPHDESGWSDYCNSKREKGSLFSDDDETPTERRSTQRMLREMHKLEQIYAQEDERMMIRLIKIRESLWT